MSPNLSEQHHYIVTVSDKWIRKAQEIWKEEQRRAEGKYKNIFKHEHGWCGKIGEWAVYTAFPNLTPITQNFNPTKHDFRGRSGLIHEVKTNASDNVFENDGRDFNVNDKQYLKNNNDTYIGCYYMPGSPFIRICGWIYKKMVETRGHKVEKGTVLSAKRNLVASRTFWKVPYKEMNAMFLFPDHN